MLTICGVHLSLYNDIAGRKNVNVDRIKMMSSKLDGTFVPSIRIERKATESKISIPFFAHMVVT